MRPWRHALLAVFFIAAMSQGQTPRQSGGPSLEPEYFEFGEGHAYMGSERIVWGHGKLVFMKRVATMKGDGKFLETTEKLDPPKEALNRFWTQVDAAGVWQWQASYTSAMSNLPDGSSWSLEARHANRQVKSQGYNAVPATYSEFRNAVYQLLEAARRKPAVNENAHAGAM
jgi:hypothetical protein